jgi:rhodanese-related sulfurtransferase
MAIPRITKETLKEQLDAGTPPVIVDVRLKYPYEHSTLTLPGAVRLAPDDVDTAELPKDRDVVVYDSDPDEIVSARAAATLIDRGYRAAALKGGLPEWAAANLPTDTKEARRTGPVATGAAGA